MKLTVRDVEGSRDLTLELDGSERIEVVKGRISDAWTGWSRVELCLVRELNRKEVVDGVTVEAAGLKDGDALRLMSRSKLTEAAELNKTRTGKAEDGDAEMWGVFQADENAKVSIKVRQNETGNIASTITWRNESHTLGNSLRHALIQNPDVLQCGYSIPHPLEPNMVMDITARSYPPDLVSHSLNGVADLLENSVALFDQAIHEFDSKMEVDQ